MLKYIFKRLLMLIPIIIGISFLIYFVMSLSPGDPARIILGEYATQEAVDELREEMGLNDSIFVQYTRYMIMHSKEIWVLPIRPNSQLSKKF